MRALRPVDRFQIVVTVLVLVLGVLILVRAAMRHAPADSYGIGGVFLAYGAYRARFILRALRRNRTCA